MAIKWKKAEYIDGPRGGHYSLQGFTEVTEKYEEQRGNSGGRGRRIRHLSKPLAKTIIPAVSTEIHEQTGETLLSGEFMVQESGDNMSKLTSMLKRGLAQMVDEDEHNDMLGLEVVTVIEEEKIEEETEVFEDVTLEGSDVDKQTKEAEAKQRLADIKAKKKGTAKKG